MLGGQVTLDCAVGLLRVQEPVDLKTPGEVGSRSASENVYHLSF